MHILSTWQNCEGVGNRGNSTIKYLCPMMPKVHRWEGTFVIPWARQGPNAGGHTKEGAYRTVRSLLGVAFVACSRGTVISSPCAFSQHLTGPVNPHPWCARLPWALHEVVERNAKRAKRLPCGTGHPIWQNAKWTKRYGAGLGRGTCLFGVTAVPKSSTYGLPWQGVWAATTTNAFVRRWCGGPPLLYASPLGHRTPADLKIPAKKQKATPDIERVVRCGVHTMQ